MPIPVVCGHCRSRLKAPDNTGGRQIRCPKCKAVIAIPAPESRSAFDSRLPDRFIVVFAGDDQQYGPVSRADLDTWLAEGRIDHTAEVWQEGSSDWKSATAFYPQLDSEGESEPPVAAVIKPPEPAPEPAKPAPPERPASPPVKAAAPPVKPGPKPSPSREVPPTAGPAAMAPTIPDPGPGLGPAGTAAPAGLVNAPPPGSIAVVPSQNAPATPLAGPTTTGSIGPSGPAPGVSGPAAVAPQTNAPPSGPAKAIGPKVVGPGAAGPGAAGPKAVGPGAIPAGAVKPGAIGPAAVPGKPVLPTGTGPANAPFQLNIDTSVSGRMKKGRTKVRRVASSGDAIATTIPKKMAEDGTETPTGPAKSRVVAGLLGLFLGGFGAHSFYLGNRSKGILQLVISIVTCGLGGFWGLFEGIMILAGAVKTDAAGQPLT